MNFELAILDIRKLEDYCLNPSHVRGRHKARVFRDALGLERKDAGWLRTVLLSAVGTAEVTQAGSDKFGCRWQVDVPVARQGRRAVVRSLWIVRTDEETPRFVTCWVL